MIDVDPYEIGRGTNQGGYKLLLRNYPRVVHVDSASDCHVNILT